jgi:hypothetical protein
MAKSTCSERSHAVSTVKKSKARIPWVLRPQNSPLAGTSSRRGGTDPVRLEEGADLVAETLIQSLASSPRIATHPTGDCLWPSAGSALPPRG